MSDREAGSGFVVTTPVNWADINLQADDARATVDALVGTAGGPVASDPAARERIGDLVEEQAGRARAAGGLFLSLLSTEVEGQAVGASLLVAATPSGLAVGEKEFPTMAARFEGDGAEAAVVDLPCGHAVRVRQRLSAQVPGKNNIAVESLKYFLEVPGRDALLVLDFSTPVVEAANALVEVFDGIAREFRWTTA